MTGEWTPVSVDFLTDPAMVAAGPDGKLLYLAGLCYAQKHTTDGLIPKVVLPVLLAQAPAKAKVVDRLVELAKWADEGAAYRIVQWHRWNDPAEVVAARRERERQRKAEWRRKKSGPDAGRDAGRDTSRPLLPAPAPSTAPITTPPVTYAEAAIEGVELWIERELQAEMQRGTVRNPDGLRGALASRADHDRANRLATEYPSLSASEIAGVLSGNVSILNQHRRSS